MPKFLPISFGVPEKQERSQARNIATHCGVSLTEEQVNAYVKYRQDPAYYQSSDQALLYLCLTPVERDKFDTKRRMDIAGL